jgi:hypothetical protein
MWYKFVQYLLTAATTKIKPGRTGVDLILQISTALLITFAATVVLVHAEVYFAQSLSLIEIPPRSDLPH